MTVRVVELTSSSGINLNETTLHDIVGNSITDPKIAVSLLVDVRKFVKARIDLQLVGRDPYSRRPLAHRVNENVDTLFFFEDSRFCGIDFFLEVNADNFSNVTHFGKSYSTKIFNDSGDAPVVRSRRRFLQKASEPQDDSYLDIDQLIDLVYRDSEGNSLTSDDHAWDEDVHNALLN